MRTDPWKILGVRRSADKKHVTAAYRQLAKKWHPDINASSRAKNRWDEISWAYDILINDKPVPMVAVEPRIEHTFVSFFSAPAETEVPIQGRMPKGSRISWDFKGRKKEIVFAVDTSPGDVRVCNVDQEMLFLVFVKPESSPA